MLGFTDLLWVLYMFLFHRLPVSAPKISLLIQGSGAVLLALSLISVKLVVEQLAPGRRYVASISMLLVGFYGPFGELVAAGQRSQLADAVCLHKRVVGVALSRT